MNKIKLSKGFIISYTLLTILTIVGFFLLIWFDVLKRKQPSMTDAYNMGFGYYSDPIEGQCITKTGKCSEKGTQTITKKCISHPITGRGCLLADGSMSYDDLVETQGCKKQCIGSAFNVSDGLDFIERVDENNVPYTIVLGSGGNQIINNFGINVTDQFIETFNAKENKYILKRCFNPNQYQVYSTTTYDCQAVDSDKASNNCVFTCGIDDASAIRTTLINDNDIGVKVPNYPKVDGRYVCFDKFGNNQIEVFNSGNIPNDFVYPNFCYDHFVNYGTSYSFTLSTTVNLNQEYFTFLNQTLPEYNLYFDYNFYHPLEIGNENTMVERIINLDTYTSQDLDDSGYVYIDLDTDLSSKLNIKIVSGTSFITLENNVGFFSMEDENIIGVSTNTFLDDSTMTISDYFYKGNTMFLNYSNSVPAVNDYIFFKINSYDVDHQSNFGKITSVDTGTSSFGVSVFDLFDDAYKYKIKFWNVNKYFNGKIETTTSLKNRVENNKYFLSDLLLPQLDFLPTNNNKLVNLYDINFISLVPKDIFYLYSGTNNSFYYPASRFNYTNSTKFNIEEYPQVDFYLLEGGLQNTIYPPNKFLNLPSFEEFTGFIQAETVASSYDNNIYTSYIKQLKLLSNGVSRSSFDNGFQILLSNGSSYIISHFKGNIGNNTVVKKLSSFSQNINNATENRDNPYVDKIKLYANIFPTESFDNQFGNNFQFNIKELRATVLKADYTVFRTPSICFNEFNLPVQPGTIKQLQPGQKITFNKKDTLNSDDHTCGFYGVSGGLYSLQDRKKFLPSLGLSTLISKDYNSYFNYLDFLTPGYELEDLYCFKNLGGSVKNEASVLCREPYTTRNYKLNTYYNPDEDLLEQFKTVNLFYSNQDNNIISPASAKFWNMIVDYNSREFVNDDIGIYSKFNNYYFIYQTNQEGFTGEDLAKIGVYYLYNKSTAIYQGSSPALFNNDYYLFRNYYQNNWTPSNVDSNGVSKEIFKTQPLSIYNNNQDDNFIYDINVNIGTSLGSSLYNTEYTIGTKNSFQTGDFVIPDFNLFNSALLQEGISVFSFDKNTGYQQIENNNTLITNAHINDRARNGDLVFIAFDNQYSILDDDYYLGTNIYNYAFEVCRITSIDTSNNNINLERNLMNYPKTSLFNGASVPFMAYKFSKQFNLNLLFPITNVLDNEITFQAPIFYNNITSLTGVSIGQNQQSRTALSLRIIKKEVEIPNSSLIDTNLKLYLMSSPEDIQLSSYLDLITKVQISVGNFAYYFNELKTNNYQDNTQDTNFKTGDVITFNFPNNVTYDIQIIGTKVTYNNSLYDYYGVTNQDINQVITTNYGVCYFNFTSTNLPIYTSPIIETINPEHKDKIEIKTNNIGSSILPINYSNLYYQGLSESFTASYYNNTFINLVNNQLKFDIASDNLIKMTLKSTRLFDDINNSNSYLIINNIVSNEKPFGPTYLNDLATSNNLDFSGYGTIVSFDITDDFLKNKIKNSTTILTSLSGMKFGFSENIAKFSFVNAIKNINPYNFNQTYTQDEIVSYNYNSSLIYNNNNDVVSLFDNGNYNQPYYIFQDNVYKFPLYLEEITGGSSLSVTGISGVKLWYDNLNSETNKPNINIYKEFTNQGLSVNSVWKQTTNSLYPIIDVLEYNNNEYYTTGQIVEYNNDVYQSLTDNFNITPVDNGISWQFFDKYTELYNNKGNFINVNTGVSTVASDLTLTTKLDTVNYPISIIDYSNNKFYSLFTNIKGIINYQDKLSGFLNLSLFDLQKEILAKIIIIKNPNNNNIASLAASPCTEDDLTSGYGFFKQFSPYQSGDILSQYIYDINLPDKDTIGKPFCSDKNKNPKMNSDVSSYQFANSISFLPTPIDLKYQDYPMTIYNGTSTCDLPPNSIFNYQGVSTINAIVESSNGDINYKTISFAKSFYTNLDNLGGSATRYNSYTIKGNLIKGNNLAASYDNSSGVSSFYITDLTANEGNIQFTNNQYFKIINDSNDLLAVGRVVSNQKTITNIVETNLNILKQYQNKVNVLGSFESKEFTSVNIIKVPNNLILTPSSTLTTGNYTIYPIENNSQIDCYLVFDNGTFVSFDKIFINNSDLTIGDKIYFLPPGLENQLKIKLYGFFQEEYLSPIVYQTKNLIKSSQGNLVNLIFSPFNNQLLNPYKTNIQLIESDDTDVVINDYQSEEYNDVFNLNIDNNQLVLTTNHSKYPIYDTNGNINNDITILPNIGTSTLGFISTNSVIDLISKPFDINNYIVLGGISDIIPTQAENNDSTNYYRQTKGALNTNLNYLLNCSIYQEDINDNYVVNQSIDCYQNLKGLYNIVPKGTSGAIYEGKIENSLYNTETVFFQSDKTNQDSPLYISLEGGNNFKDNLIYNTTQGTSRDVIIKYYFNSTEVSRYYDLDLYDKASNKYLTVTVTKNNFFQDLDNYTLYLGTSSPITGPYQFTNGISTLTYKDN